MRKANTLKEAIQRFSPEPISFGAHSPNKQFYTPRPDDPLSDLRIRLLYAPHSSGKTLLAGHRGTGKTTELNRLAADPEVQAQFKVVNFNVRDTLELEDIDHIDLLVTMVSQTLLALRDIDQAGELKESTVRSLCDWRDTVIERMEQTEHGSSGELKTGAGVTGLLGFFTKFTARYRYENTTREVVRKVTQPRISEFLDRLTGFFLDVQAVLDKQLGKRLLVVNEDLDKMSSLERAKALFEQKGNYLNGPPVRVIYTIPIGLHYATNFATNIRGVFDNSVLVPSVRLVESLDGRAHPKPYAQGRETMRAFVYRRMDAALIDDDAVDAAIELGAGLFDQMRNLVQSACVKALVAGLERITLEQIREAAADYRAMLERPLTSGDINILHDVAATRHASAEPQTLALLHSLHLMEYRNGGRWCDINPLLKQTLQRWPAAT